METRRFRSWLAAAVFVTVCAGCASGRARDVDCEKRSTPINERSLTITSDRLDGGGLDQSRSRQPQDDVQ